MLPLQAATPARLPVGSQAWKQMLPAEFVLPQKSPITHSWLGTDDQVPGSEHVPEVATVPPAKQTPKAAPVLSENMLQVPVFVPDGSLAPAQAPQGALTPGLQRFWEQDCGVS